MIEPMTNKQWSRFEPEEEADPENLKYLPQKTSQKNLACQLKIMNLLLKIVITSLCLEKTRGAHGRLEHYRETVIFYKII